MSAVKRKGRGWVPMCQLDFEADLANIVATGCVDANDLTLLLQSLITNREL